jgi:hypothetical protein
VRARFAKRCAKIRQQHHPRRQRGLHTAAKHGSIQAKDRGDIIFGCRTWDHVAAVLIMSASLCSGSTVASEADSLVRVVIVRESSCMRLKATRTDSMFETHSTACMRFPSQQAILNWLELSVVPLRFAVYAFDVLAQAEQRHSISTFHPSTVWFTIACFYTSRRGTRRAR